MPRSRIENGNCIIRDKQSRFGTYVNGVKVTADKVLGHGDQIQLGELRRHRDRVLRRRRGAVGGEERDLGGDRAAPDGGAARRAAGAGLGPGARRSAGDGARLGDRGDRRRARLHHAGEPREDARVQAGARARQGDALGPHLRDQPQDSGNGVRHRPADDCRGSARRRSRPAAHRHRRARHPPRALHAAAPGALRRARGA